MCVGSGIYMHVSPKRCKIGCKLLLIINRKSYMSFRLVPKSVTLNDLERRNVKVVDSHNYGPFTITMSSSKRLQRDRATPTV